MFNKILSPCGNIGLDNQGQLVVRTDRGHDGGVVYRFVVDPRPHLCVLCGKGWATTVEDFLNHYEDMRGRHMHETCRARMGHYENYTNWTCAISVAGFTYEAKDTPNQYWPAGRPYAMPWVEFKCTHRTTRKRVELVVGRRKRVTEIKTETPDLDYNMIAEKLRLFDVTKSLSNESALVHAWNVDHEKAMIQILLDPREYEAPHGTHA